MTIINSLLSNSVFLFTASICSILGFLFYLLSRIPAIRNRIFPKRKIKQQEIIGSNNLQSGGNISNSKNSNVNVQSTQIGRQKIKGNNNIQIAGDINE